MYNGLVFRVPTHPSGKGPTAIYLQAICSISEVQPRTRISDLQPLIY